MDLIHLEIECNNINGYYHLVTSYKNDESPYFDCVNETTKPSNFFLNKENKNYEPCYETCAACIFQGDGNKNKTTP